jgi:ADP-heptose:LPS heptosyltransferase
MKLHQIEFHYRLLLGDRKEIEVNPRISLQIDIGADHYVKNELSGLEITRPILLNPGGGWKTKLWSARRFAQLSKLIEIELDIPTLFTWGPGEEGLIAQIRNFEPAHVRSFPTDILELARLCTYSRLMVAGDTGPMHLAVSMGTPVVAILGPAQVWRTGPFGKNNLSITHSRPCPHPYQRKCDDHFCMDIAVEKVFEGIKKRLNTD